MATLHRWETPARERRRHRAGPVLDVTPEQEAQRIAIARITDAVITEQWRRRRLRNLLRAHALGPVRVVIIPSVVVGVGAATLALGLILSMVVAVVWAYT